MDHNCSYCAEPKCYCFQPDSPPGLSQLCCPDCIKRCDAAGSPEAFAVYAAQRHWQEIRDRVIGLVDIYTNPSSSLRDDPQREKIMRILKELM